MTLTLKGQGKSRSQQIRDKRKMQVKIVAQLPSKECFPKDRGKMLPGFSFSQEEDRISHWIKYAKDAKLKCIYWGS